MNQNLEAQTLIETVREGYGAIARESGSCCGPAACCRGSGDASAETLAQHIGYSVEELAALPEGANLGLSCGNPNALAALKPGEVVLDLGSGAGFDVFIAGRKVGPTGRVIGVDMTPEMIAKARHNAVSYREKPASTTSSSGWAKSSICPWPTRAWMSSFPTASSTYRRTSRKCGAKLPAC